MAFGTRVLVGAAARRKHEAVLRARVPLQLERRAAGLQLTLQHGHVRGGRPLVHLGAGHVGLAAQTRGGAVRRIGALRHHVGPMDGGDGGDPLREFGGGGEHERPAHAIAQRTHAARIGGGVRVQEVEHRPCVPVDEIDAQASHHGAHLVHALLTRLHDEAPRLAVVEVGQQHQVAFGRDAARHVVQLLAHAEGVHVEQHHGVGAAAAGRHHAGVHRAVGGGDVEVGFGHRMGVRGPAPARATSRASSTGSCSRCGRVRSRPGSCLGGPAPRPARA